MTRYTRKDAEAAFNRLLSVLGRRKAMNWNDVGGWSLDYASAYGGFVIAEVSNEAGGESRPMGDLRRNAREFCEAVSFAIDAIEALKVKS